ncbi:MAG: hypothetical protein IPH98_19405 [Saprospiraceae bacterium]|nr:hypothetical protein [Candidatus Defluviibacterium haderslevense]
MHSHFRIYLLTCIAILGQDNRLSYSVDGGYQTYPTAVETHGIGVSNCQCDAMLSCG